jgi:hypothetical protein
MNIIHILQKSPFQQVRTANPVIFYQTPCYINSDPIDALVTQFESSTLQAKTFFRKLFKTNPINN